VDCNVGDYMVRRDGQFPKVTNFIMKTIQMTIDESLLADVDRAVNELGTNRSLFIRNALQSALRQHTIEKLEERHAAGYRQQPANDDQVAEWASEQVWGDK
jgi:hypothetical protein